MTDLSTATRRRYVIIGAGAVGTALAAGFEDAGIPAVLVARPRSLEAIRTTGLRLRHGAAQRVLSVTAVGSAEEIDLLPEDVLVLATKTQDAAAAFATWSSRPVAGVAAPAGSVLPVLVVQNGLAAEELAVRWFRSVLSGTTLIAASHLEPGSVQVHTGPRYGQLIVGSALGAARSGDASGPATAEDVAADLSAAGWLSQAVPEPRRWKAWKLLQSVTFAVDVLGGDAARIDALRTAIRDEAATVLAAAREALARPADELRYDVALARPDWSPGFVPGRFSTWQSFERGSSSEVDYLNGEIVALARRHGTVAPWNEALQAVLGDAAAHRQPPGARDVHEVLKLAEARLPTSSGA